MGVWKHWGCRPRLRSHSQPPAGRTHRTNRTQPNPRAPVSTLRVKPAAGTVAKGIFPTPVRNWAGTECDSRLLSWL